MKQSRKPGRALVLTLTLCVVLASRCAGVVYVKWDSPGPILDGASWPTAFHSIQAGLDGANPAGDEVWGARGTYTGNVILRPGVSIYGGFAGTETSRAQRNWQLNPTVIDGGGTGAVITGEDSCAIDGFVVKNGDFGVLCSERSPTVTNNRIIGNIQGIYCWWSSPVIANNIVAGNDCGINCDHESAAVITNNTIVGNGTALECAYSSPTVTNNILAFSGVGVRAISASPMLSHNDVCGNVSGYEGAAAGDGDISADPLFASLDLGNLHIQPNSRCRNAGVNGAPSMPETDMDGQPRIMGDTVDMGADESDGQFAASSFRVIHVNASAAPGGDGGSWSRAYRTIQAAGDAISGGGGEIWVARGTYYECAKLPPFAQLYGGFAGTENSRSERNWKQNISAIDAGMNGFAVTAPSFSTVDGFTLRNGLDGVHCTSGAPMIANNTISGNASGVYCGNGHPDIRCNTFSGNDCAIYSDYGAPMISNNIISNASSDGVYCWSGSPKIANNIVSGAVNCGLYFAGGSPSLANTIIAFNGIGVRSIKSAASLSHNDVYANTISYDGIGAGPGDISADPQFANSGGGDFHLGPDSPCVNAGDNLAAGMPSADIDGEARIVNGTVDIGPYERWYARLSSSADGTSVQIRGSAVTAAFDGHFYTESDDRSWGIRVNKTSHELSAGMRADVQGTVGTNADGARYVDATSVVPAGTGLVEPIFLVNRAVGGADWNYNPSTGAGQRGVFEGTGLNNIGLLVTIWGNVTFAGRGYFYLDDGSKLNDDSGHIGVKVSAPGLSIPSSGFVWVTGISSCEKKGEDLVRVLRVRKQADIIPL